MPSFVDRSPPFETAAGGIVQERKNIIVPMQNLAFTQESSPPRPMSVARKGNKQAKVLFDFDGENSNELTSNGF